MKISLIVGSLVMVTGLIFSVSQVNVKRAPASTGSLELAPEKYVVDDQLRLFGFDKKQFFYTSNTQSTSKLIIQNKIEGQKRIQVKLQCSNSISNLETSIKYGKEVSVLLPPIVSSCVLNYAGEGANAVGITTIRNEAVAFPILRELHIARDIGASSDANELPIQKYFLSNTINNATGVLGTDNFETLDTREVGFLEKMKALIGYDLGEEFIKHQDPYADIDFSRAPKLDAVFVSTLVYRADFYGTVLARALKYQADQGAVVHVVTTGYMMLDKDKALLEPLAFQHPNIRLQEFKYTDTSYNLGRPFRYIDSKYRDMHVKMFVTISKKNPNDNVVIFGGRNIHDGFLFRTLPDHSKYPKLVQYGKDKDDDFVSWNDFEMKLISPDIARSTYAHLLNFWHRDTYNQVMDEATSVIGSKELPSSSLFRHIISIPYKDNHALEKLFVDMIDKAKLTIRISSPYLRPTPAISDALARAVLRGVQIDIQTRINLEGDTQAWLYSEVNKESINKFYKQIKIYEWKENSILHSKFILVDGKVAFIGSVNLSRRSFIQDVENGFLIESEEVVQKMNTIFEGYITKSKRIDEKQSRKYMATVLIYLLKNQF